MQFLPRLRSSVRRWSSTVQMSKERVRREEITRRWMALNLCQTSNIASRQSVLYSQKDHVRCLMLHRNDGTTAFPDPAILKLNHKVSGPVSSYVVQHCSGQVNLLWALVSHMECQSVTPNTFHSFPLWMFYDHFSSFRFQHTWKQLLVNTFIQLFPRKMYMHIRASNHSFLLPPFGVLGGGIHQNSVFFAFFFLSIDSQTT